MEEIEIERTFLIKTLPQKLETFPHKILFDIYIPSTNRHPSLRLRQKGESYEMTKKIWLDENDHSEQKELTIPLTQEEFAELSTIAGKKVKKMRYLYPYKGLTAEIDVFQDALEGLVVVDFEFKSSAEKNVFEIPAWCLADVTQEEFLAGGMLAGKSYKDIEKLLSKFGYKKLK
ncbi:MAG: CYTH domain-containing protein [Candidatus Levyibacteriota bacterium]